MLEMEKVKRIKNLSIKNCKWISICLKKIENKSGTTEIIEENENFNYNNNNDINDKTVSSSPK